MLPVLVTKKLKSGFTVTLDVGAGNTAIPTPPAGCTNPGSNYYASAVPLTLNSTGTRSFSTNAQGTIFYNNTAIAPLEAIFTTTATPIQ